MNAPLSAEKMVCPSCEKDEVGTYTADDSFLYGVKNTVRLIAKDVEFFRCATCGLEYTGKDGEIKRQKAVEDHLATLSLEKCNACPTPALCTVEGDCMERRVHKDLAGTRAAKSVRVESLSSKTEVDYVACLRAQVSFGHDTISLTSEIVTKLADEIERLQQHQISGHLAECGCLLAVGGWPYHSSRTCLSLRSSDETVAYSERATFIELLNLAEHFLSQRQPDADERALCKRIADTLTAAPAHETNSHRMPVRASSEGERSPEQHGHDSGLRSGQVPYPVPINWQLLDMALGNAAKAIPVLFTMLTTAGLRQGAVVADQINADVKAAMKELAHFRESTTEKTPEPQPVQSWPEFINERAREREAAEKTPAAPLPCEHLRSELLAEKKTAGEPVFQMRRCIDCEKIFRMRSSVNGDA